MVGGGRTVAIDPEFAFYGPVGFDLGAMWANAVIAGVRGAVLDRPADFRAHVAAITPTAGRPFAWSSTGCGPHASTRSCPKRSWSVGCPRMAGRGGLRGDEGDPAHGRLRPRHRHRDARGARTHGSRRRGGPDRPSIAGGTAGDRCGRCLELVEKAWRREPGVPARPRRLSGDPGLYAASAARGPPDGAPTRSAWRPRHGRPRAPIMVRFTSTRSSTHPMTTSRSPRSLAFVALSPHCRCSSGRARRPAPQAPASSTAGEAPGRRERVGRCQRVGIGRRRRSRAVRCAAGQDRARPPARLGRLLRAVAAGAKSRPRRSTSTSTSPAPATTTTSRRPTCSARSTRSAAIIVDHGLAATVNPLIEKAVAAGIPVVAFDVETENPKVVSIQQSDVDAGKRISRSS